MSTEKLSELSKPVGFVSKQAQALLKSGDTASIRPFFDVQGSSPLYSQEYVSALIQRAERLDSMLTESVQALKAVEQRNADLESANKSQDDHINQQQDRIDSLEKTNAGLGRRLGAAEKRIIELDYLRLSACEVFKEIGSEIGCNPDNESIMMAIDALKERLATPVRLLGEMLLHDWEHSVERQATFQHRKIAWDARLAEDKKAILAAGFTFTVEGDEQ